MVPKVGCRPHPPAMTMDRRTLLRHTAGALALGVSGCALGAYRPRYGSQRRRIVPVRASWDRVIRTSVGLRPYRPSGFVLRAERLSDKLLVHNFGHGGAGMSLSWGTGHLAADLALLREERSAAVLGCGVVGLTCARQLQRRGFRVTIYAKDLPPHTTSNRSLAAWTPTSGLVSSTARTREWDRQFRAAATIAYEQLQILVGRGYGVSWLDGYTLLHQAPSDAPSSNARSPLLPAELRTAARLLGPGEHPFPTPYVSVRPSLRIEPSIYLDRLVDDVRGAGGQIVVRSFAGLAGVAALDEAIVVNCTGLGAGPLFGDREIRPLKGQLTVLMPQPEVDYSTFGAATRVPGGFVHMSPRSDGIALGGTSVEGDGTMTVDEAARNRIVEAHIDLFSRMS